MSDPIVLAELSVIFVCVVFYVWWFSPTQRRKRLRQRNAQRVAWQRMLHGLTDATDDTGNDVEPEVPQGDRGRQ